MRLTVHSDFALRLLMYLALSDGRLATIADVAARYGISRNHLMKVAYNLGVAGYIETVRGRSGGLRLARPAQDINLGDVVRSTEPDMALVPCFKPIEEDCAIASCCGLRGALARANATFLAVLDEYSLADLVKQRAPMRALLGIEPAPDRRAAVGAAR